MAPAPAPAPPPAPLTKSDPKKGTGLLDEMGEEPGIITLRPPNQAPAPSPAPGGAPPPTTPATASASGAELADVLHATIAQGVYVTPPPPGSPLAAALAKLADQCHTTPTEAAKALVAIGRNASVKPAVLQASDQKEQGRALVVTVSPPSTPLPAAFSCLSGPTPAELRLELLVGGRDFGPLDNLAVSSGDVGALAASLDAVYGAPGNPWRLATAVELLAIMPAIFSESLWGPDGAEYWTSTTLRNGEQVVIKAQTKGQDYKASIEARSAASKARPLWIRAGSP